MNRIRCGATTLLAAVVVLLAIARGALAGDFGRGLSTSSGVDEVAADTSGASDPHHTRATSERLAATLPNARIVEPPWGDREWIERGVARVNGEGGLFSRWPLLAPILLDWAADVVESV